MATAAHLWAIGYDEIRRAEQVRDEIERLADRHFLVVLDAAVAVCYADGSTTVDGEAFIDAGNNHRHGFARLLGALALAAPPLVSAEVSMVLRRTGTCNTAASIDETFIGEVQKLMKPGTSVLFVLNREGDMDAILRGIQGLGGSVLRTNVDLERLRLIQSTLSAGETSDGNYWHPSNDVIHEKPSK